MISKRKRTSHNVIRDVEPHLPDTPTLWTEIVRRVDCWAPASIKIALEELVTLGKASRITLKDDRGFERHLYSKVSS